MKKFVVILAVFLCSLAKETYATPITFDDIDASFGDVSLDGISPYQELTWTNFYVYTAFAGFDGFNNGVVSGTNGAYSGGETFGSGIAPVVGTITSDSLFNLESLYLGSGYYDGLQVTIEGKRAGSTIASTTVNVDTTGAVFTNLNFLGLNEIDIYAVATASTTDPYFCGSFNCTQFTIDDLTLSPSSYTPPPSLVSEPSTLPLFGLAAITLGMVWRKHCKACAKATT